MVISPYLWKFTLAHNNPGILYLSSTAELWQGQKAV
jgi:hypothetical protein